MRRLIRKLRAKRSERGATTVVVGVLMVALVGFAAVGVDVGAAWWDRKQAQNGADAAALAVAQACAKGNCGTPNATAQDYANKNRNGTDAYTGTAVVDNAAGKVTATVTTTRHHWFAPILGINTTDVSARAVAQWGVPTKGATLPLTVSMCWFLFQTGSTSGDPPPTGTSIVIPLFSKDKTGDGSLTCGTQAAHNEAAGGFGWLDVTSGCTAAIDLTNPLVDGNTGLSGPGCLASKLHVGDTILLPVFEEWTGNGNNTKYKIKAFAALTITDYCFGPGMSEHTGWPGCKNLPVMNNDDKGYNLSGTFVKMVELGDAIDLGGGTNMGAKVVKLID